VTSDAHEELLEIWKIDRLAEYRRNQLASRIFSWNSIGPAGYQINRDFGNAARDFPCHLHPFIPGIPKLQTIASIFASVANILRPSAPLEAMLMV
jgi:hypothetical protein